MRHMRAILRLLLLSLWTMTWLPVLGMGWAILWWSRRRQARWRQFIVLCWARGASRIIGMRIKVQGEPPEQPFFLVTNHLSYIDVVLLQTQLKTTFISKSEVKNWPIFGFLSRIVGTLFIDRQLRKDVVRMNQAIEAILSQEGSVVFFPEGTSSKGDKVYPFKPPLLDFPASANLPVAHASISYTTPGTESPAHLSICWWGDMTFADHFYNLLMLPYFEAVLVFGQHPVQASDRKVLASELNQHVQRHFTPVVTETIV